MYNTNIDDYQLPYLFLST